MNHVLLTTLGGIVLGIGLTAAVIVWTYKDRWR